MKKQSQKKKMKIFKIIIFILCFITVFSVFATAFAKTIQVEYKEYTFSKTELNKEIENLKENNIYTDDGIELEFDSYNIISEENQTKEISLTSDSKILQSNSNSTLNSNFENTYSYEDEKYAGTLNRVSYNVETINNGYSERIDTQTITTTGYEKYNDLNLIDKEKTINGTDYVLISVDWQPDQTENLDGQTVAKTYKAVSTYQAVIREPNPNTYRVSANYSGTVNLKDSNNVTVEVKYKEVEKVEEIVEEPVIEEKTNYTPIILGVVGGILVLIAILYFTRPNVFIYNLNKDKLVKIASFRVYKNKTLDITNKKRYSENYLLKIRNFEKVENKKVTIKDGKKKYKLILGSPEINFYLNK